MKKPCLFRYKILISPQCSQPCFTCSASANAEGKGNLRRSLHQTSHLRGVQKEATIERVASKLAEDPRMEGFAGETEHAILGDLLLCFCLENAKHALGRKEQVQRVAPAHYLASWVGLPESVVSLRYVPEMIVAMLADQRGDYIQQNGENDRSFFAVGKGFESNLLLRAFHQGVTWRAGPGELASRTSDRFEEETPVGLDQLLMIRLAQQVGASPDKLRGGEGERISNQRPIAEQAAASFFRRHSSLRSLVYLRHSWPLRFCGATRIVHGDWNDNDYHQCD